MGDVYIFRDQVVFEVPLKAPYSGPLNITLTFQGCADAGLCYPPEQTNLQASETQPPANLPIGTPQTAQPPTRMLTRHKVLSPRPKVKTAVLAR
ncbi:hypothetical protein HSBAA_28190 [Vreelandella sulfidaeris]|uniref:Thiol:disulfide interchange protein DsbD N-terminal domain-containing protein n=1 Tax=Vreelandella sulfidaeris TaxID=115553 RepID=A0A455U8F6_9GAMM|nr:hypothetical protein HSBAA_28190 [Halomonas sulfidaeris]